MESSSIRSIFVIPARLESSRLPNKILEEIGNEPMVKRVLDSCSKASNKESVILCTDSKKVSELASRWGYKVIMTSKECSSGSHRISTVIDEIVSYVWKDKLNEWTKEERLKAFLKTAIINVQGDQPFLEPLILKSLRHKIESFLSLPDVITPIYRLKKENIHNPAVVKALIVQDKAIYFSRSALPHVRDVDPDKWHEHCVYWGHLGIYCFRADILSKWSSMKISKLEKLEKLEQLRLLESGYQIKTIEIDNGSLSIDTFEQLEIARKMVNND